MYPAAGALRGPKSTVRTYELVRIKWNILLRLGQSTIRFGSDGALDSFHSSLSQHTNPPTTSLSNTKKVPKPPRLLLCAKACVEQIPELPLCKLTSSVFSNGGKAIASTTTVAFIKWRRYALKLPRVGS